MTNQNNKKKLLIIQGNPDKTSFCDALAESYKEGAIRANADVKEIYVREIEFDPFLPFGYKNKVELEQGLIESQELIQWADHLVFVYPHGGGLCRHC